MSKNSEFGEVNLILAGQRGGSQIMKQGFIILCLSFHPYLSSTPQIRCVFIFYDQSSLEGLHAINLGDSGLIVVRDGCTIFRSPVQQHDFNFTYQLESGNGGDLPSSGQVFTIPVAPGEVVIAGTDGLFDNLYNNEVTAVVAHAMRAGLGPQVTAQKIAALACQRVQDKNRQTPFSTAAQDTGSVIMVASLMTSPSSFPILPAPEINQKKGIPLNGEKTEAQKDASVGDIVVLKSIIRPTETVAIGVLKSTDAFKKVEGEEL
ncbi:unnamed protein product [Camellia sinensis]